MPFVTLGLPNHDNLPGVSSTDHHTPTVAGDLALAGLATRAHADLSDAPVAAHQSNTVVMDVPLVKKQTTDYVYSTNRGDHALSILGVGDDFWALFTVPSNFAALTSVEIIFVPDATETIQWDILTDFGILGELNDANSDSSVNDTLAVVDRTLIAADITSEFTGLAAGDIVGLRGNSDIASLNIALLRVTYTI